MQLTDKLVLGLPLDEIDGKQNLYDNSGHNTEPQAQGEPALMPDDYFGSCVHFDDSGQQCIRINNLTQFPTGDLSLNIWVKTANTENKGCIFNFADTNGQTLFCLQDPSALSVNIHREVVHTSEAVNDGQWHHISVNWQPESGELVLIIDGNVAHTAPLSSAQLLPASGNALLGQKSVANSSDFESGQSFEGELAHCYLYQSTLDPAQVKTLMDNNKTAQVAFKHEYPINFEFVDDEEHNVLYISDLNSSNVVNLHLKNTAFLNIQIMPREEKLASKDNYHFCVTFKPRTLINQLNQATPQQQYIRPNNLPNGWAVSDTQELVDGMVCFYLLYTGEQPLLLENEKCLSFELEYSSADGTNGARGTHAMLSYQHLSYDNQQGVFTGERIVNLNIVNQRGKKNIPLSASIVGSNTILNDVNVATNAKGGANSIVIRLVNTLNPHQDSNTSTQLTFNTGEVDSSRNSQFTLVFDDAVGTDWDLASSEELQQIQATVRHSGSDQEHTLTANVLGDSPVFSFVAPSAVLKAGEYFEITLNNIRTDYASGLANIYLNYEDIPGYWDGRFVVQVLKSPIVHRNLTDEDQHRRKNIGMGILPDKEHRLKVEGHLAVTQKLKERYHDGKYYDLVPSGTIVMWHHADKTKDLPGGWALCDGESYKKPDGSNVTTPDLSGRFVVAAIPTDRTPKDGNTRYNSGSKGGSDTVTLSKNELPIHNHAIDDPGHSHSASDSGHGHSINDPGHSHPTNTPMRKSSTDVDDDSLPIYARNRTNIDSTRSSKTNISIRDGKANINVRSAKTKISTLDAGSGQAHENRPPYYALCYIMKL